MRVPTVKVRNKATGETMIVNEADYAQGSLTSDMQLNASGWERVGEETTGEQDDFSKKEADEAAADSKVAMTSAALNPPSQADIAAKQAATASVKDKAK
jgi:hypothetical protein